MIDTPLNIFINFWQDVEIIGVLFAVIPVLIMAVISMIDI